MSHSNDPTVSRTIAPDTPEDGIWRSAFSRLGIRASFLVGFGIMCALMILVSATALFATARIGDAANNILDEQLPTTLEILRAARAVDALAATSAPLLSVTTEDDRAIAFDRVNNAQDALEVALQELGIADSAAEAGDIHLLSEELAGNLWRLREMVDQRIELVLAQEDARARLLANLQAFQQHLTYRVRILEGDSDIISLLMNGSSPPLDRVAAMAQNTAPLIPLARFYAQVESIGGRLLAATQAPNLPALNLSRQVLSTALTSAEETFEKLPSDVAQSLSEIFADLHEISLNDDGIVALRERELILFAESQALNLESQQITRRVDTATAELVRRGLEEVSLAGASAAESQQRYLWLLTVVTSLSLLGILAFMRLHVVRNLIERLSLLSQTMQSIAAGQFDIPLPPAGSDELGRLGAAVRQFHSTALETGRREAELEILNSKLADLSTQDFLTGLANRRRFDEVLNNEWTRGMRAQQPLALIMIDVDHFKPFNDKYGHQAGDDCLRQVAEVLRAHIRRASDLAARYGGEEFSVILADANATETYALAEKIRKAVEALAVPHLDSEYRVVTVSIGMATVIPTEVESPEGLLRTADAALYQAKASGRNRLVMAQGVL